MKIQRFMIIAVLGLMLITFFPCIVNAIHCTSSTCECTEVDEEEDECVGTGYRCYCIGDKVWGEEIECSGPYIPGEGCQPCDEYEDDDETFYVDCNSKNGWHPTGSPYECLNGSQTCTCQNEEYRDHYCSGGKCPKNVTDEMTTYSECYPTSTTTTSTSTTSSTPATTTTTDTTSTTTTETSISPTSTTTSTTETLTSSTTTTLPTCSMRNGNCALTSDSNFTDCCEELNCLPATAWNPDDGVCCHPRECILDGSCIEEGYRGDDGRVCQDGAWIWVNCSTRDENCALTTESDFPECCVGLNCLLTSSMNSDDGVCCYPRECILEGNCVEEGYRRVDGRVCQGGSWLSENETTTSTTLATTITETTFDEIIWEKEEHKNVFISYDSACVNEPVKIKAQDEKGNPLKNAVFSIKIGGSFSGYGEVDDAGEFSFTPEETGEYNIKVMRGDYFGVWNITLEVCEEGEIQKKTSFTVSLSAEKEVTAGDEFNITVEIHAKDDIGGVNASIYLPEGFSVEHPSIRDETEIRKGENKSITWHVKTADSLTPGNYSLKVSVSPLTADKRDISNSTTIQVHEQKKDLIRIIQENTYGFTEKVYEVASNPPTWTILLLLLLGLSYIYYSKAHRRQAKKQEAEEEIKKAAQTKTKVEGG